MFGLGKSVTIRNLRGIKIEQTSFSLLRMAEGESVIWGVK